MAAGAPAFVPTDPPWALVDNQGRLHVVTSREHLHAVGREYRLVSNGREREDSFANLEQWVGLIKCKHITGHVNG
jgi:hypothetical protein